MACTNLACVTNLVGAPMGNGRALELNTNDPAFLRYFATEVTGETNLVLDNGAIMFWLRPQWSTPDQGGCGPGDKSTLIEVGNFSTNASSPFWSLYVDSGGSNLFFSSATNGASSNYFSAPVSWTSNSWHLIVINYSCSNSCLFLDGAVAATGQGVCYLPGPAALANGFLVGSQSNGLCQAKADFSRLSTYDALLDSGTINAEYQLIGAMYYGVTLSGFAQGPYGPDAFGSGATFDVVSGSGNLTSTGPASSCVTGGQVYITNVSCTLQTNLTSTLRFTVAGGQANSPYDLFGIATLPNSLAAGQWSWLGQVFDCNNYELTNQPTSTAFYILGNSQDTDNDGLTDAFEILVSKTSPTNAFSVSGTVPDGWWVLNGMPPVSGADSLDPDLDGLSNVQEYLYGTRPLVSEGFSIWVCQPAGNGGLP